MILDMDAKTERKVQTKKEIYPNLFSTVVN